MDIKEKEAEYRSIQRQFRSTAGASLVVLLTGVVFYHAVEHLRWLDSVYLSTVTLTTIGYGDIAPKTDAGKIFTCVYVLVGIGIIAFFANILVKNAVSKRQLKIAKKKIKSQ